MTTLKELAKLADILDRKGLRAEANYVDVLVKKAASPAEGLAMLVSRNATALAEALKSGDVDAAMKKYSEIKQLLVDIASKMPAKEKAKPQLSREQKPSGLQQRLQN